MAGSGIGRRSVVVGAGLLAAAGPHMAFGAGAKPKVLIATAKGNILVELEAQRAPLTTTNFLHYVDTHSYDNGQFYRANRDPSIKGGGSIVGSPALKSHPFPPIKHESTTKTGLKHLAGTISLGRFEPGTATSNFFICASDEPYLDAHPGEPGDNLGYAAFGHVLEGMPVVHKILAMPTNGKTKFKEQRGQWLTNPVTIVSMRRV